MFLLRPACRLLRAAPRAPAPPRCGPVAPPAPPAAPGPARLPAPPADPAPPAPPAPGLLGLLARALPCRAPPPGPRVSAVSLPGRPAAWVLEQLPPPRSLSLSPRESRLSAPAPAASPALRCRNVLKIRRRKMNHHKYRKLVKRTRFLRRRVREGRLKRKQAKFEGDLRRIWLKAGLKDAPPGWQTPKIYLKGK